QRNAIKLLRETASSPDQIDFLASEVLERPARYAETSVDQKIILESILQQHRRHFGDVPTQWPLWNALLAISDAQPEELDRLLRQRVLAASQMRAPRGAIEAKLSLMERL